MISKQVGNIKLQYDESVVDIDRIVEIIKLNQCLFADYKGKIILLGTSHLSEDDNVVCISDFDKFFDDLLKKLLEDNNLASSLDYPDLLPALYVQLLVKKAIQNGENVVMFDNDIADDVFWFMIACKFFDHETEFSELSNFLKYRNDSERIFEWLKETQRFNTYNYLLEVVSGYLKEYDLSFFDNIGEIISKMNDESISLATLLPKESSYDLPKMSLEDIETIFFEFLNSIRAPEQWKTLYTKLKNENKILFEESIDGLDHSEVFEDVDGIRKIRVTTDGTIKCFVSFVHEFIHYVSLQGDMPPFSLLEFPPIYYERVAANYLISIGYDESVIKQVIRDRNQNNFDIYGSLFGLLLDVYIYTKKGPITRDDKIEPFKKSMEEIFEVKKNLAKICEDAGCPIEDSDFLTMPSYNFEESVDKECDEKISRFIKSGLLVLNGYQYLTDSYLADSVLENQDDETILDKMVFITEHLADFNIEKVMNYLGIDNTFEPRFRSVKQ